MFIYRLSYGGMTHVASSKFQEVEGKIAWNSL